MANTEIITLIPETTAECLTYMIPIIGILAGINFIVSWLMSVTMGMGKRTFRG